MAETDQGVAIVTGAAGGMGAAIAYAFAEEGRPLILSDLVAEALEPVAEACRVKTTVRTVHGDISGADYPGELLSALGEARIGALAHAAGVSPSMTDGARIMDINFWATIRLVEAVLPKMAEGAAAVLVASNSAHMAASPDLDTQIREMFEGRTPAITPMLHGNPGMAYSVSKRGVQLYAQRMAPAFGRVGARVVSLSPGLIDTNMGQLEKSAGPTMDKLLSVTPAGAMGKPEHIASAVAFLASPAASYITGTDILVDGGTVAGVTEAGGVMNL